MFLGGQGGSMGEGQWSEAKCQFLPLGHNIPGLGKNGWQLLEDLEVLVARGRRRASSVPR